MLEMLFRTSSKGFYAFFDEKDGVACIKTEPFKAWFVDFFCCGLRLATRWVATLKMTRFFKIAPKIQIFSTNFKISKQIQNLPKILKKIKQIPRKFPNPKQSPKKFHKNTKAPPPALIFSL